MQRPTLGELLDFVWARENEPPYLRNSAAQLEHIMRARGELRSTSVWANGRRRFKRAAGLSYEEIATAVAAADASACGCSSRGENRKAPRPYGLRYAR